MISDSDATRQILRISGLRDFPKFKEAIDSLVSALQQASRDPEHAKRITDKVLEGFIFCPTPAQIYPLAASEDREYNPREWRCSCCGGTGWESVYELHTWAGQQKTVERVTRERYQELSKVVSGQIGEQVVTEAMIRCAHCKLGRDRALAAQTEAAEATA